MKYRHYILSAWCLGICFVAFSTEAGALQPDEIAIIVNSNSADSAAIADYYCLKRQVPQANIIALPMPHEEIIARLTYEQDIAPKIRARLNEADMKGRIQCLLTVKGVPLRIGPVLLKPTERQRRELIRVMLNEKFGELQDLTKSLKQLAESTSTIPDKTANKKTNFRFPKFRSMRDRLAVTMLIEANQAINLAQQSLRDSVTKGLPDQDRLRSFQELAGAWLGLRGKYQNLTVQLNILTDENHKQLLQSKLQELESRLKKLSEIVEQGRQQREDISLQEKYYQAIYDMSGLQGLCNTLLVDRHHMGDEESQSSFDSELSLVLWKPYRKAQWQFNQLRTYEQEMLKAGNVEPFISFWLGERASDGPGYMGQGQPDDPAMMVCRLDGPTREIALGLIDKALAAQKQPLRGTAYFDARGIYKDQQIMGSEGFYDQALRDAAELIKNETILTVKLDDEEELFAPGACPDTTLYCGWYSLGKFVDSFQFNVGAIGYHIASVEAHTLGFTDPNSNLWCKRMLEEGVTATLGAVAEPYLHGFVRPDQFFAELISGKYCLVECFYHVKPFNSWMLTLIGDPLYRPTFARQKRGFRPVF